MPAEVSLPRTDAATPSAPVKRAWLLRLAIIIAAAWWVALVALALFTANPVVVSRAQIAASDAVVTAKISHDKIDTVTVERVWTGDVPEAEITVVNLRNAPLSQKDGLYILPLMKLGGDYRLTMLPRQEAPPIIYPATPDALDQLRHLVRETHPEPRK